MTLGFHSWLAPLQTLSLIVNLRLILRQNGVKEQNPNGYSLVLDDIDASYLSCSQN